MNKFNAISLVGELGIGTLIGVISREKVLPHTRNNVEKALCVAGTFAVGWYAGRKFTKEIRQIEKDYLNQNQTEES